MLKTLIGSFDRCPAAQTSCNSRDKSHFSNPKDRRGHAQWGKDNAQRKHKPTTTENISAAMYPGLVAGSWTFPLSAANSADRQRFHRVQPFLARFEGKRWKSHCESGTPNPLSGIFPQGSPQFAGHFSGSRLMPKWKEISRIAKDPSAVRILAKTLLRMSEMEWNVWEVAFLKNMTTQQEPLTTRQSEKLLEIRDAAQYFSTYDGFNIESLIEKSWMARADLDDEQDVAFIERLKASGAKSVRRRQVKRLFRCCRELLILEQAA